MIAPAVDLFSRITKLRRPELHPWSDRSVC
jgi:hypothetical protein